MIVKFYSLSDPRTPDDIRYIGKTKQNINRRLEQHISAAKKCAKDENYKNYNCNWINSLLKEGIRPIINELDSFECGDYSTDWVIYEKYWISQFKSWGFSLTNLTDGGDGNQNQKFSEESIKKRASKIKGIPRPEDVRRKISESHKGVPNSKEHNEHTRESIIKKQGRAVYQYTLNGDFVKEWRCIAEAADFYKVDRTSLMRCCQGKFKKSAGFKWKYKNEDII